MFWGLIMEPQRRYSQKVKKSFHVSMAALDVSTSDNESAQVMCGFEGRNYLLCTLKKPDMIQCPLDLNFTEGDEVSFAANGKSHVHLTGYLTDEFNMDGEEEEVEEEEEDDEDVEEEEIVSKKQQKKRNKAQQLVNGQLKKKMKLEEIEEEESSDEDYIATQLLGDENEEDESSDDDNDVMEGEEDSDDEDAEEDDEDEDAEEEEEEEDTKKKPKMNGIAEKPKKQKKNQEPEVKPQQQKQKEKNKQQQAQQQKPQKRALQGGVIIEDLKEGQGAGAKNGRFVSVYYEGRLQKSNKLFDSATKGNGFRFRLGTGEVIKGWDIGVAGMKVGGKRRIICPPQMAYGPKGSPPAIPPNATLVFDVEMKKIS